MPLPLQCLFDEVDRLSYAVYSKTFTLNTGDKIPAIGLGTWQSAPNEVRGAVKAALQKGYRHIDTALAYGNEKEVGQGIKDSGVPREEIWLTTKLDNTWHHIVSKGIETSLKDLATSPMRDETAISAGKIAEKNEYASCDARPNRLSSSIPLHVRFATSLKDSPRRSHMDEIGLCEMCRQMLASSLWCSIVPGSFAHSDC